MSDNVIHIDDIRSRRLPALYKPLKQQAQAVDVVGRRVDDREGQLGGAPGVHRLEAGDAQEVAAGAVPGVGPGVVLEVLVEQIEHCRSGKHNATHPRTCQTPYMQPK